MIFAILITFCIGLATVLQGALNRIISGQHDLAIAVLLNSIIYVMGAVILFFLSRKYGGSLPNILKPHGGWENISWWYLIPGLCGLVIVVGMPVVIMKIGVFRMFMIIIAIQLIGSLLWDKFIEQIQPTPLRIIGACLAFISVILTSIKKA